MSRSLAITKPECRRYTALPVMTGHGVYAGAMEPSTTAATPSQTAGQRRSWSHSLPERLIRFARNPLVRWGFLACAVGLSVFALAKNWHDITIELSRIGWARAGISLPLMASGLLAGMLSWRRILAGLGSRVSPTVGGQIYFIGQLGKYLPGAVWPVISQMELGSDQRIPRRRSVLALLLAVLIAVATGLGVGGTIAALSLGDQHRWLWLLVVGAALVATLLVPSVLWGLARRLPFLRTTFTDRISGRNMCLATAWCLAGWALYGLHVFVLTTAVGADPVRSLLLGIGGYALAWCAGMVAFLLPAGAGARDAVLVLVLSSALSTGAALAVAVVSRVVTTVADLGWAGAAFALTRSRQRVASH